MPQSEIKFTSTNHRQVIDVTNDLNRLLAQQHVNTEWVHLFLLHATAGLTTVMLDPETDLDLLGAIQIILPKKYQALQNAAQLPSHLVALFIGQELTVPIKDGQLLLGHLQRTILIELNGPHERIIVVAW